MFDRPENGVAGILATMRAESTLPRRRQMLNYPYEVHDEFPCWECGSYDALVDGDGEVEHLNCRGCGQRLLTYRVSWPRESPPSL